MIAGAGAVATALALSPAAVAEPAPAPPVPGLQQLPFANQLATLPAMAPQIIQGFASVLTGGGNAAAAAVPVAPAPTATAALTLPQAPGVAALPAAAAAAAPVAGVQNLLPAAQVGLPQGAGLNLPSQLAFPGDLASLMPAGSPLAGLLPTGQSTAAAIPGAAISPVSAATGLMPMFPVSGLP